MIGHVHVCLIMLILPTIIWVDFICVIWSLCELWYNLSRFKSEHFYCVLVLLVFFLISQFRLVLAWLLGLWQILPITFIQLFMFNFSFQCWKQVIEAQVDMPIVGAITLYVSLLTFTLRVHPDRLDYVDQVLVRHCSFFIVDNDC